MKRPSGSPEITAAAITVVGSLLVSVILSYIEGRVGFMAVLAVLAVLLVVALIVMLYRYAGPKVTGGAFVSMLVIGFLVFLAFGRGWPKGTREARSVTATAVPTEGAANARQSATTSAPTLTSQATTAPQGTATSAATATATQGQELAKEINMNLATEPPTIDPNLATDTTSVQCDEMFFLGLTDYDEKTLEVIPELATEWKVSDDGLVWTFKMRKDVEWVRYDPATKKTQKMGKVTAHDIVYSVKRTLDPSTASDYAHVDYIIKNGQAVNTGESKNLDSIGVKALDDYTVEFTLEQPAGYFPGIAGMWVNRPVPQKAIEESGDKWTEPGNIWTNGSYMLESWEHEKGMVMTKNPYHFDAKNVSIEKINWVMVNEDSTAFAMYENGELDVQNPPLDDMDRVKADPQLSKELYIAPVLCTYYFGFNTTKPPFDNAKVRKAFSMAIDRQKLIDTVLKGGQLPAKSFACPGIFGSVAEDANFKGVSFDPVGAKALLAEAGFPGGKGLPKITLMFNTTDANAKIAQFAQQSWKENLGANVELANQEWAAYLKTVAEDAPQMYRMGWCADYPDQNNWVLENFHPVKSPNNPKWNLEKDPSAKRFAELVDQAAAASKPEDRKKAYFEAEKILVEDQAIIAPIYYNTRVVCTKPYAQRGYAPFGGEHIDRWKVLAHGTHAQWIGGSGEGEAIKIAILLPLSGDVKTFGESTMNGAMMAIEEAKAKGQKIEVVIGDSKCDAQEAANVASKVISQDKVKYIIGEVCSSASIPISGIANKNKVLQISPTSTNPAVTVNEDGSVKPYTFRACFLDPFQGEVNAALAMELGAKKAAVLYDVGNDYVKGLAGYFKAAFEKKGGQVPVYEAYTKDDTDFSAILGKVAAANVDVMFLPDYYPKVNLIAAQAKEKGITAVMIGGDGWDSPELKLDLLEGCYFSNHYSPDDPRPEVQNFVQAYKAKYGTVPDALAALAYDAANILLQSIKDAGKNDPTVVKDKMAAIQFKGVSGDISFDKNHDPIKKAVIIKIQGGKTTFYKFVAP